MACEFVFTDEFRRDAKKLAKKYRSLTNDLRLLLESFQENPRQGVKLFGTVYKTRMAIKK